MSVTTGERRVVSVLVADIAGSTPIAEKLGPERYKFLFDEIVRSMREEVERFEGTVAQLTGDGVLALFGAPTAHEDDAERSVRAALAIREAIGRYSAEVGSAYGIELAARVAVNTGPVVIPAGGAPPHELYNALGETVTVAARLQAAGDLVVGAATAQQVSALFELEELGDLELKGKTETVAAFRVAGVREGAPTAVESVFVGRHHELEALSGVIDGLIEGTGGIVSVDGEPGIGKSRLVAETRARFRDRVRFLAGHAVPYAEAIPYWPLRGLLRDWLGLGMSEPEARVRLELRTQLDRLLVENADEAYPFLAAMLGVALGPEQEERIRAFAPDAVQQQTVDWLYRIVCLLGEEQPLCLVLEDLHWSDEATLTLLDELLPAAEQTQVCFVLVHRSDPEHPAWKLVDRAGRRFRNLFHDLALEPLLDGEAQALAEADAGGELPEELALLLTERAGGNPFFVGEAVRDLLERGALRRENGGLVLVGELSVPAAVQGALQARLDRLDPEAREVITTASVIGHSFGLPLLERLMPRTRLLPTLSELQWLQLVTEERSGAAPEYRFRHGLVQEVAYGTLLDARRRELHRAVGEALEEIHRDAPAEVYGLLAHHFVEADEPARAVEYLLKAGDAARAVHAEDEAIARYRRALDFMERTGDEGQARRTWLRLGLTHHLAFDYHAANEAFGEAFALSEPAPARLEPRERITWAMTSAWDGELAPGHGFGLPSHEVGCHLFRGLVSIGRDFEIEPDLAERFAVSDDGRTYRFTIREDAHWSDGAPITSDDFAFTYTRMVEDEVTDAYMLEGLSATALDARTLEIQLVEPRSHFLYLLGYPSVLGAWPRHVYERDGRDWHRQVPLVGSGPFALTSRNEDRVVIKASPTWFGPRGNVGEVTIEMESRDVAMDRWRRGSYDILDLNFSERAEATDQAIVERTPGLLTWYVAFNQGRAPVDDPRVRRALAHAIDRHGPARALRATPAATGGWIPPAMPGHSHRVAPEFDPDRARELLREAGYADGGALGEVVLAYMDLWEEASCDVAAQLEAIGVRVRHVRTVSDPELAAVVEEGAHHCFVWAINAFYPDPGNLCEPKDPDWRRFHYYLDQRLEQLLTRAASLRDQDERLRAYREFEQIWIGEQAAVVPLAYGDRFLCRRPWVTGMWSIAFTMSTFADAVVLPERRP
jgi:ABC-type transport system substrate-binding protein/class 3 adenylate cyclase